MNKVLMFFEELHPWGGGIGRYVQTLSNSLVWLGCDLKLVGSRVQSEDPGLMPGVNVSWIGKVGLRSVGALAKPLMYLYWSARVKPNIIIFPSLATLILGTAVLPFLSAKKIVVIHGSEINWIYGRSGLARILVRSLIKRARVVSISSYVAKRFYQNGGRCRGLRVIYNSVDRKGTVDRHSEARSSGGGDATIPYVLTVARLDPRKSHSSVLNALCLLPGYHYFIVGKGETREQLEELTNELGLTERVHFKGFVSDDELEHIYSCAFAFILPSVEHRGYVEGFGLVLLEAAARGCSLIGFNHGGIPEVLDHGRAGLIVDGSPESIASAVHQIARDVDGQGFRGKRMEQLLRERYSPAHQALAILDFA